MNTTAFAFPELNEAFTWLLQATVRGTLVTVVVLLVQTLFRQWLPARWRYGLWLAVLIALILPRTPQSEVSVARYASPEVVRYVFPLTSTGPATARSTAGGAIDPIGSAPTSSHARLGWRDVLAVTWLGGAVLIAGIWLVSHQVLLRRISRAATPPSPELTALAQACAETNGLRRKPEVIQSCRVGSPAVAGCWRPKLLLPANLASHFDGDEQRFILLHECAHIRRGDLWMNMASALLLALHWVNPILWLAAVRVRADREEACDATVLGLSPGDSREGYGRTLIKLQQAVSLSPLCPAFVGIMERASTVRRRLLRIICFHRGGRIAGAAAVLVTAALVVCVGTEPKLSRHSASAAVEPVLDITTNSTDRVTGDPMQLEAHLLKRIARTQSVEVEARIIQLHENTPEIRRQLSLPPIAEINSDALVGITYVPKEEKEKFESKLTSAGAHVLSAPRITAKSDQRAVIEIIREFRYPVKWSDPVSLDPKAANVPTPISFETRNLGVTFDVTPVVFLQQRGDSTIDLKIEPKLVFFAGWTSDKTPGGYPIKHPKFAENLKSTHDVSISNKQMVVLAGDLDVPVEGFDANRKITDPSVDDVPMTRKIVVWLITAKLVPNTVDNDAIALRMFERRDWKLTNAPIDECIAHFTEQSRVMDPTHLGLNLILSQQASADPRMVTMDVKAMSLVSALEVAAKAAGMKVEDQGGNTLLITP